MPALLCMSNSVSFDVFFVCMFLMNKHTFKSFTEKICAAAFICPICIQSCCRSKYWRFTLNKTCLAREMVTVKGLVSKTRILLRQLLLNSALWRKLLISVSSLPLIIELRQNWTVQIFTICWVGYLRFGCGRPPVRKFDYLFFWLFFNPNANNYNYFITLAI